MAEEYTPDSPEYVPPTTPKPTLADLLTIEPSVSIFYSYARELEQSAQFSDKDAKLTIFAPTNRAIMAFPRKPHLGPDHPDNDLTGLSEEEADMRSKSFVQQWVGSHIVAEYPFDFNKPAHRTLGRNSISLKTFATSDDSDGSGHKWGKFTIENVSPTGIHILGKREGLNGDLYLIDGVADAWAVMTPT